MENRPNLFITMVLAGLWHGANWTFVIFGAIHGIVLAVGALLFPGQGEVPGCTLPGLSAGFFSLWAQRNFDLQHPLLSLAFFRGDLAHFSGANCWRGLSNFTGGVNTLRRS